MSSSKSISLVVQLVILNASSIILRIPHFYRHILKVSFYKISFQIFSTSSSWYFRMFLRTDVKTTSSCSAVIANFYNRNNTKSALHLCRIRGSKCSTGTTCLLMSSVACLKLREVSGLSSISRIFQTIQFVKLILTCNDYKQQPDWWSKYKWLYCV